MKRMALVVMFAAATFVASAAVAWDIPSKIPTNTEELKNVGTSMALQNALNEKLKNANCEFNGATKQVRGCDLKKLGTELGAAYKAAASQGYRVYIKVAAADATAGSKKGKKEGKVESLPSGYDRANFAVEEMKRGGGALVDSWRWDSTSDQSLGNRLSLSVKVEK